MQYFLFLFAIPFIYLNLKIIISDIKVKKIPNKYVGYLLLMIPFWFLFLFFIIPSLNYLSFIWEIFLTLFISFVLYYFWIWAAGDAKYLLVLSLFIPHIWVVSLIWNIALLTLVYLFWFFIYFYIWKILFKKNYRKSLFLNIKEELSTKWEIYKTNKWWKTFSIIFKWTFAFLVVFVSLRLIRLYIISNFFSNNNNIELFQNIIEKYNFYLIFLLIVIFFGIIYLIRLSINVSKNFISSKFKYNYKFIWDIIIVILFVCLITFIIHQYLIAPAEILSLLYKILTLYLALFIFIKILIYSYKITFLVSETTFINVNKLKEWDIVDKIFLIKMFWTQKSLWAFSSEEEIEESKKCLLYPSPKKYFQNLENPIDKKDLTILKKVFKITNNFHKKDKKESYTENNSIKILKTFSFAPYILLWFIITVIFSNNIIKYISNFIFSLLTR